MYHILIVDDEAKIRQIVRKYAEFEGHTVDEACDGFQAVNMALNNDYDIIIMDVMMPVLNGFSAADEILKKKSVPIILLSARGEEYDRISGLQIGVDDYIVKPFSPKELMLRINAVLRRYAPVVNLKLESMGISVDTQARKVVIDNIKVELSPKEYSLLVYFLEHKGEAISRERFITEIWGYDYDGFDRTLDTHIKLLRKNLGRYADCIETVRGVGYRFEESKH